MSALLHPGRIISLAHAARLAPAKSGMSTEYTADVSELLGLLQRRQIPFVVVGGIALLQHVRGRNTEDIDLIISAPKLQEIPELVVRERTEMFVLGEYRGLRVDVLLAEHPVFNLVAREHSAPMAYAVGTLNTATVDGLILLKLFALPSLYRQFDLDRAAIYEADVMQLLSRSSRDDEFFLRSLAPHLLESDQKEIARILSETRERVQRMRRGTT